ncbi:MAG: hypothetical protein L0Y79_08100 [Chlorobi bacterium]|nr:hypothetical protein [Chlorobiota bacterium]MCI0715470.1 hypothetical protein [Chlorobiota bacterium]
MFNKTGLYLFFIFFSALFSKSLSQEKAIDDYNFRFTFKLPDGWEMKDLKQTKDKDGISYSFERKDKKMTIMLLAFKLSSVKNIDDFIYNMEKDISLNIPQKIGSYDEKDFGTYDMKSGRYKDNNFEELIFYFRTKLPDAPNNYVYMLRFIMELKEYNTDTENKVKEVAGTFKSTAE